MAEALGFEGMHSLQGYKCDFCGQGCDPEAEELNALDCTFAQCPQEAAVYHQDCLEKYLKSVRLEKSRKTGFKCPRGCGKGTKFSDSCPGKITKSHPIHIRNDEAKKRKKAQPAPVLERPKAAKEKGKAKDEVAKLRANPNKDEKPVRKPAPAAKPIPAAKPATPSLVKAAAKVTALGDKPVLRSAAPPSKKEQLVAAVSAAKRELGLKPVALIKASGKAGKEAAASTRTLDEHERRQPSARGSHRPALSSVLANNVSSLSAAKATAAAVKQVSAPIAVPVRSSGQQRGGQPRQQGVPASAEGGTSPVPSLGSSWSAVLQLSTAGSAAPDKIAGLGKAQQPQLMALSKLTSAAEPQSQPGLSEPSSERSSTLMQPKRTEDAVRVPSRQQGGKTWPMQGKPAAESNRHRPRARALHQADRKVRRASANGQVASSLSARGSFASSDISTEATSDGLAEQFSMSHDHDDDILEEPEAEAEDEISELDSQGLPEEALAKPAETKPAALSLAGSSMQDSMLSQCIEAMHKHRLQQEAAKMSVLGFESWQCLAALTHAQGNLHQAAACLLGGHLDTPAQAQRLLSQPDVERALLAEEQASHLDQLQQAQAVCGVRQDLLQQTVVEHGGDVAAALASLCESHSNEGSSGTTQHSGSGPHDKADSSPGDVAFTRSSSPEFSSVHCPWALHGGMQAPPRPGQASIQQHAEDAGYQHPAANVDETSNGGHPNSATGWAAHVSDYKQQQQQRAKQPSLHELLWQSSPQHCPGWFKTEPDHHEQTQYMNQHQPKEPVGTSCHDSIWGASVFASSQPSLQQPPGSRFLPAQQHAGIGNSMPHLNVEPVALSSNFMTTSSMLSHAGWESPGRIAGSYQQGSWPPQGRLHAVLGDHGVAGGSPGLSYGTSTLHNAFSSIPAGSPHTSPDTPIWSYAPASPMHNQPFHPLHGAVTCLPKLQAAAAQQGFAEGAQANADWRTLSPLAQQQRRTVPGQAMAVPEAALLAAAAITGDMPARHAGQAPSERSELESLMATLLCR